MVSGWPARDPADARASIDCLWLYSPTSGLVTVWHNEGVHPAETLTLVDLRRFRSEPDLEAGYAYRGAEPDAWRLTTDDHESVTDRAAARAVLDAVVPADRDGVRPPPTATGGWDDLRLQPSRIPPG
jgi:hypothetical protein